MFTAGECRNVGGGMHNLRARKLLSSRNFNPLLELSVTRHTLGRELRAMGYRKLTARPRHRGQKGDDIADFKKALPPVWRRSSGVSREERQ